MITIRKSQAPACLEELKATPGADWGSVRGDQKDLLRKATLRDQGFLCAYCMRRIRDLNDKGVPEMDIEHWEARSTGADPFLWQNLLGVCRGDLGGEAHCDKARGNREISVHPARASSRVEERTRYLGDGTISMENGEGDISTLNLNHPMLKRGRRQVADALVQSCGKADLTRLRALLSRWESPNAAGLRPEYAGVGIYLLRKAIRHREERGLRLKTQNR